MIKKMILSAMMLMAMVGQMKADNADIYVDDVQATAGENVVVSLMLKGAEAVSGWECNVVVPEGFGITKVTRGSLVKVLDDDDEYIFTFDNSIKEDGSRYLLCYTSKDYAITKEGELAKITIGVDGIVKDGTYELKLTGIETAADGVAKNSYTEYKATITVGNATAIKNVNSANYNKVTKALDKNQVIIKKGKKTYTTVGAEIK